MRGVVWNATAGTIYYASAGMFTIELNRNFDTFNTLYMYRRV